jgi:hypothetical protein
MPRIDPTGYRAAIANPSFAAAYVDELVIRLETEPVQHLADKVMSDGGIADGTGLVCLCYPARTNTQMEILKGIYNL